MTVLRAFAAIVVLLGCVSTRAADAPTERVRPKEIGSRTVVLDFTVDDDDNPIGFDLVSSEAEGLNLWAWALIAAGNVKTDSRGVVKLGNGKFRATISFPLKDDGAPLPPDIELPKARRQPHPRYPLELVNSDTTGGALLRLTLNRKGKITKVELVRASHEKFGLAAVRAAKLWRFAEPAKKDGAGIEVTLFQLFTFEITGKRAADWEWQMSPEPAFPVYKVTGSYIQIDSEELEKLTLVERKAPLEHMGL